MTGKSWQEPKLSKQGKVEKKWEGKKKKKPILHMSQKLIIPTYTMMEDVQNYKFRTMSVARQKVLLYYFIKYYYGFLHIMVINLIRYFSKNKSLLKTLWRKSTKIRKIYSTLFFFNPSFLSRIYFRAVNVLDTSKVTP